MSPNTETATTVLAQVTFTPFKAEDALGMTLTAQAQNSMRGLDLAENYRYKEKSGPGWTMWVDGKVAGCAGLIIPWEGVALAWLFPTDLLELYPKTVVLTVVHTLRDLISQFHLRRVDCDVEVGFTRGERFARAIGFVPFGPVKLRWGPNDTDFQPYVILQPRESPDAA